MYQRKQRFNFPSRHLGFLDIFMNVTTKFLSGCNSLGSPFDILRGEKVQLLESENGQHVPQLFDRHYNFHLLDTFATGSSFHEDFADNSCPSHSICFWQSTFVTDLQTGKCHTQYVTPRLNRRRLRATTIDSDCFNNKNTSDISSLSYNSKTFKGIKVGMMIRSCPTEAWWTFRLWQRYIGCCWFRGYETQFSDSFQLKRVSDFIFHYIPAPMWPDPS